jgi:glycosyltransferase involved in cell wall biosynthesis
VYTDSLHADLEQGGTRIAAASTVDAPFLIFVAEVGRHFERTIVFGRKLDESQAGFVPTPATLELAALPAYESLSAIGQAWRSARGTLRALWRGLDDVDVVWCFGPHPFAIALALLARLRRKRVVLGVRQDPVRYFEVRSGGAGGPRMALARATARIFRVLARSAPVTAVGPEIAAAYPGSTVLDMRISLVPESRVAAAPHNAPSGERVRLLTVGRIAPEKNPELMLRALAALNEQGGRRYELTWVGTGELVEETQALARELQLEDLLSLPGQIPFGEGLWQRYESADLFVHVALTEGVPQVLLEALASGLPVVATDVGGVRAATADGRAALLVPPDDLPALVRAVGELAGDASLARGLAEAGLALAREHTLEREADRAARFLRS